MLAAMRAPLFRPWAIVAAVFVVFTVSSGLTIYSLSVYLHAFVASGRFTIEEASLASSTFMAAGGLVAFGVGRLVDRHDVRLVMSGGTAMMVAAQRITLSQWSHSSTAVSRRGMSATNS